MDVDVRKLFNKVVECCEEEVPKRDYNLSAIELNPQIEDALKKLKNGLDKLERETKEMKASIEENLNSLEDILNSLY